LLHFTRLSIQIKFFFLIDGRSFFLRLLFIGVNGYRYPRKYGEQCQ